MSATNRSGGTPALRAARRARVCQSATQGGSLERRTFGLFVPKLVAFRRTRAHPVRECAAGGDPTPLGHTSAGSARERWDWNPVAVGWCELRLVDPGSGSPPAECF